MGRGDICVGVWGGGCMCVCVGGGDVCVYVCVGRGGVCVYVCVGRRDVCVCGEGDVCVYVCMDIHVQYVKSGVGIYKKSLHLAKRTCFLFITFVLACVLYPVQAKHKIVPFAL